MHFPLYFWTLHFVIEWNDTQEHSLQSAVWTSSVPPWWGGQRWPQHHRTTRFHAGRAGAHCREDTAGAHSGEKRATQTISCLGGVHTSSCWLSTKKYMNRNALGMEEIRLNLGFDDTVFSRLYFLSHLDMEPDVLWTKTTPLVIQWWLVNEWIPILGTLLIRIR